MFGAGVLIQSGGKRLRAPGPQPLVEVPNIELEVVFEIVHVMSAGHTERLGKFAGLSLARILKLWEMTQEDVFGRELRSKRQVARTSIKHAEVSPQTTYIPSRWTAHPPHTHIALRL